MKIIKRLFLLIFLITISISLAIYWKNYQIRQNEKMSRQFYSLITISKDRIFDISKYNVVDWDEMIFISPYTSLCDYGIDGYPSDSKFCQTSTDDTQCWLVFLKNNHLVTQISVNRRLIDFTKTNLDKKRINRNDAVFEVENVMEFPAASLHQDK